MAREYEPATPRNLGDHDAPHVSPITPAEDFRTIKLNEVSWSAIFVGVVIALVTQLLLNLLGIGIGVATIDPGAGASPDATTFSIAAGIWWVVSGIIAAFVGGYAAGRVSGRPKETTAGWHGLAAWATTTLVLLYLLTSTLGSIAGGAFSGVASAMGTQTGTEVTQQATDLAQQAQQAAEQAQDAVQDVAETATTAVATAAIFSFIALVLGAIAGWFGGWFGAVYPTMTGFVPLRRVDEDNR